MAKNKLNVVSNSTTSNACPMPKKDKGLMKNVKQLAKSKIKYLDNIK